MKNLKQNIMALSAALVWGLAFSCQSICSERGMGVFQFNFSRAFVACIPLFILCVVFAGGFKRLVNTLKDKKYLSTLLLGGFVCGIFLFASHTFQQAALKGSSCGKVGFITTVYVILVPLLGLFAHHKVGVNVWLGVFIALVGMVFLCIKPDESMALSVSDLLAFCCSLACAIHILCIAYFASRVDGIQLSLVQTLVAGIIGLACSLIFEKPSVTVAIDCIWYVLYMGFISLGVGYTLQIFAQKGSNPTVISLLMSFEAVFSVIFAAIFIGEQLTLREYIGCGIMFVAIIFAQLPEEMFAFIVPSKRVGRENGR